MRKMSDNTAATESDDVSSTAHKKTRDVSGDDPWKLIDPPDSGKSMTEKTLLEKARTICAVACKLCLLVVLLYLFVCSLDFLSNAFRLLGGKRTGEAFQANAILSNPIADLTMGVLATVLLQSSSTTTSIVVSMVAAEILPVRPAIFVVMGANIGTSVTNTIVAMGQALDRDEFRRAFAGATVHDMFNWLSVLVLLPVEWVSGAFGKWEGCGLLCQLTGAITDSLKTKDGGSNADQELLKVITSPFTELVIQLDKDVLKEIAQDTVDASEASLVKHDCEVRKRLPYIIPADNSTVNASCKIGWRLETTTEHCRFLFATPSRVWGWSDEEVGGCLLVIALVILIACLVSIVKLLHSLLKGHIAKVIKKFFNADLPGKAGKILTGYIAILVGTGLTILVQSSSIFTSAITPLVGVGVLHIERMYPLTLGANIGTTVTAVLAALAADADKLAVTLQVALCHLFFNIFGILIWYPIPRMRKIPIWLAKGLGSTTARFRWFAVVYLVAMFFVLPAAVFALSLAGWEVLLGVMMPIVVLISVVIVINAIQRKKPDMLPRRLRTWDFLPKPLHSLQPYDRIFQPCAKCVREESKQRDDVIDVEGVVVEVESCGNVNKGFDENTEHFDSIKTVL